MGMRPSELHFQKVAPGSGEWRGMAGADTGKEKGHQLGATADLAGGVRAWTREVALQWTERPVDGE